MNLLVKLIHQKKTIIMLTDSFGRNHDYLRISLTERCNLRCFYCMPEEGIALRDKAEFMTSEEIIHIAKTFVGLGVKKIRLTGGEPLIKKDIQSIIRQLGELPIELAITTNGVLVDKYIEDFKRARIKSINVSLDSLKTDKVNQITRRDYGTRIRNNINLLIQEGFNVKVNTVLIKGTNDDEIIDFVEWTREVKIGLHFIEFMPFDGNKWNRDQTMSYAEILRVLEAHFGKNHVIRISDKKNDTAKNFQIKDFVGHFGIISTITNPFCDGCNRIRLTADGKIKNCLFSANETDLLSALRNGDDIEELIEENIRRKKEKRAGIQSFESKSGESLFSRNRSMTSIGG